MKARVLGLGICLFAMHMTSADCTAQASKRQTAFCEEGAPDDMLLKPVSTPRYVLNAVMNSKEARQVRAEAREKGSELNPEELLRGTIIKLSNDQAKTYLVMGADPLSGADNTWFWIVRTSGRQASVLLWVGASCVNIKQTSTNGYRDVVADWSSAAEMLTQVYRYNGKVYRLSSRKSRAR